MAEGKCEVMADVKWIKITTDVFDDEKILLIESLPEADSIIVIWFKLLCLAGKQNNSGVFMMGNSIPYTDKMLATIFRRKESTVQLALKTFEQFGMVQLIDGVLTIPNWGKHQNLDQLENKKEYMRNYMKVYREKQKALTSKDNCKTNNKANVRQADKEEDKEKDKKKKKKKESEKETTLDLYNRLLPDYTIIYHDNLRAKMIEWITYKTQRKEEYQEQGMKTLLRRIENNSLTYGDQAVCDLIDESMSNGWKGIIFDKLQQKGKQQNQGRKEMVPSWMQKKPGFNDYQQNTYDFEELERDILANGPVTVNDDPELKARAEALKEKLGGE